MYYGYTLREILAETGLEIEESTLALCFAGWRRRASSPVRPGEKRHKRSTAFGPRPSGNLPPARRSGTESTIH